MGEEDCARKTVPYAPWVLKKRRLVVIEFNGLRFLLSNESKTRFCVCPVEVKSSRNYTAVSFHAFKEAFSGRIGQFVIVHPKAYSADMEVVRIPPYMFPFFMERRDFVVHSSEAALTLLNAPTT